MHLELRKIPWVFINQSPTYLLHNLSFRATRETHRVLSIKVVATGAIKSFFSENSALGCIQNSVRPELKGCKYVMLYNKMQFFTTMNNILSACKEKVLQYVTPIYFMPKKHFNTFKASQNSLSFGIVPDTGP